MSRSLVISAVLVSVVAHGQFTTLDPATLERETGAKATRARVQTSGQNRLVEATLAAPFCVEALKLCVPAKATVQLELDGAGVRVREVREAPTAFSAWGLRFERGSSLLLNYVPAQRWPAYASGVLERAAELDGHWLTGSVAFNLDERGPTTVRSGTLAKDTVLHGWRVPAGYSVEERGDAWKFEKVDLFAKAATPVERGPFPAAVTSLEAGVDQPTRYQTTAPFTVGEVTFAAGGLRVAGALVLGTLGAPMKVEALKVPAGSLVEWCNDASGLQFASKADRGLTLGQLKVGAVHVVHDSEPVRARHRNASQCHPGAAREFLIELDARQCCPGGARPLEPEPVLVTLDGATSADEAAQLEAALAPCSGSCIGGRVP
jgi:hypothetical protein